MNIGIVTTWYESGAAYVSKGFESILSTRSNVHIYARGGDKYGIGDKNWDKANVTWDKKINVPITTGLNISQFKKWLSTNKIDTVIFNEQHWWIPILVCNDLGIKTGAYIDYYTQDTIPLFACYDFLICNTKRHFGIFSWHPQVFYIPWGTDISLFVPAAGPKENKENGIVFFHSAGMNPHRKGTDLLLLAYSGICKNAMLVIHTQRNLKQFFPNLSTVIDELVGQGRLTIIEKSISAPGLYSMGDVYVYPSRLDGIGLTIAEALACGLPVITCDNAPMNEFVNDSTGKLVKVDKFYSRSDGYYWPQCECNTCNLMEKMNFFINHKDSLDKYKKNARLYAETNLDWQKNANCLNDLICNAKSIESDVKKDGVKMALAFEEKKMRTVYMINVFKVFVFFELIVKRLKNVVKREKA
jgi:glycosyltransferase involved in cell wall biosynthesis